MESLEENIEQQINFGLNKTSPEPQVFMNLKEKHVNEAKYLSYVDQLHTKMNSNDEEILDLKENESSSEMYSQHRLQSSSTENNKSTMRFEETQGKLFIVKKIDDINTVKIPTLDLDNIIEKQKRKMYPYNMNKEGEIIELTNKASSIDTHNDEDAIIIYDEQDQDDDSESFKIDDTQNNKHSNLFNSSFMSNLSSMQKSPKQKEAKQTISEHILKASEVDDHSNHNSFLDQELNIDSIPCDKSSYQVEINNVDDKSDKSDIGFALDFFDSADGIDQINQEISPFWGIQDELQVMNNGKDEDTNIFSCDSEEDINNLNNFLSNSKQIVEHNKSREHQNNVLGDKEGKAKSVPANQHCIDEDHITFGKEGCEIMDGEEIINAFDQILLKEDYSNNLGQDENKIRNKSVVIPRSSVLLKNKKNIQKRNADQKKAFKNFSVSPSKIVYASKNTNVTKDGSCEKAYKSKVQNKGDSTKNFKKSKINFKSNKVLLRDESNQSINDWINKSKIKLNRSKIVPFKFVKQKKTLNENHSEQYGAKSKHMKSNSTVENMNKHVPSGVKQIINVNKVKVIKSDKNQELKMKGRKLNLRFKDFAHKKNLMENNSLSRVIPSDEKVNRSCFLKVRADWDYINNTSGVNAADYSTNSQVVHPQKNSVKMPSSLFQINQRRFW